jgi:Ca2+/Na+ antiporter
VTALPVHGTAVRLEWPFMFLASCAGLLVMRDGVVDRVEGGVFVVALVLFTTYMVRLARREVSGPERQEFADAAEDRSMRRSGTPRASSAARSASSRSGSCCSCSADGGSWTARPASRAPPA